MTKLEGMLSKLPVVHRHQVEDYAETLVRRNRSGLASTSDGKPNRIRVEELDGLLVRMTDEMSDEEIMKRCLNEWADAAED